MFPAQRESERSSPASAPKGGSKLCFTETSPPAAHQHCSGCLATSHVRCHYKGAAEEGLGSTRGCRVRAMFSFLGLTGS